MSQLTDTFIFELIKKGKSDDEASSILSNIQFRSIMELYNSKKLGSDEEKKLDNSLIKLIRDKAPQEKIFQILGITPADFKIQMEKNFNIYILNNSL